MECLGENASEVALLLTEAPFPPLQLQEAMNEVHCNDRLSNQTPRVRYSFQLTNSIRT